MPLPATRKGVWESVVSSPNGVWGEAPAALSFSLFVINLAGPAEPGGLGGL